MCMSILQQIFKMSVATYIIIKIDIVRMSVCVCVRPRAIKNYSREMKSE